MTGFKSKREAALAQPAQEIDWKDQYEYQKRRAEMWIAKYEKDIGPLEKVFPAAQPAQEPVAWIEHHKAGDYFVWKKPNKGTPLYTTPQPAQDAEPDELAIAYMSGFHDGKKKRPWVGLTDEEASWCQAPSTIQTWKRIEAKLKEKNT